MLPTPYMLGVKRRTVDMDTRDSHGKLRKSYADPIDWPVSGISPGASGSSVGNDNPSAPNRDLSNILWTIYAPAHANTPGELDIVVLDGNEYALDGRPSDWTLSPWDSTGFAGFVVELVRVEG